MEDKREFLETKARQARELALTAIASFGNGHVGGSMSIMDALAVLFYDAMRLDDQDPDWPHQKLDNLTVLVDNNGLQIDGTNDQVMSLGDLPAKLRAFGFDLVELPDGNDLDAVEAALSKPTMPGKPKAILAHTVKGKGVSFMENQVGWHGKAPNAEQREQALKELED